MSLDLRETLKRECSFCFLYLVMDSFFFTYGGETIYCRMAVKAEGLLILEKKSTISVSGFFLEKLPYPRMLEKP